MAAALIAGCGGGSHASKPPPAPATINLTSPAFAPNGTIPRRYTCDGAGSPPPLRWSRVPNAAKTLELFVEDPDAPGGGFEHWHLKGIAPSQRTLTGGPGWTPPCPPKGDPPHHYVFTLVARGSSGGALARGRLVGTFARR